MSHVLLVNSSSPPRGKKRRHMTAKQAKYFGKKRVRPRPARAIARPHKKRRHHVAGLRRYRRNPSLGGLSTSLSNQVMPVALGAGGALLVDMAMDKLPIPIDYRSGNKGYLARAGVSVGLGLLAGKFAGRDKGMKVMAGGLTIVAYNFIREKFLPHLTPAALPAPGTAAALQGMGNYPSLSFDDGMDGMGELLDNGMGQIDMGDDLDGMGELLDY